MKTEILEQQHPTIAPAHEPAAASNLRAIARIQTILVPTDFSPPAEKALAYASALASHFGAKLVLMHAIEPIPAPELYSPIVNETARADAEARLKAIGTGLRETGVFTREPRVVEGVGWDSIVRTAKAVQADLIVISTHGYTGLKHVFLGSTTERVVRHASCPVLVVRENEHDFIATTSSVSPA